MRSAASFPFQLVNANARKFQVKFWIQGKRKVMPHTHENSSLPAQADLYLRADFLPQRQGFLSPSVTSCLLKCQGSEGFNRSYVFVSEGSVCNSVCCRSGLISFIE